MLLSLYAMAWRPAGVMLRRGGAQPAHDRTVALMGRADGIRGLSPVAHFVGRSMMPNVPVRVGGISLPQPIIVAAGLVKGTGFADEAGALAAIDAGTDIMPGWRSLPDLVGAVEFGSFTRYPRLGNDGLVLWRDNQIQSMQNRIGLRNPGARAAAAHLRRHTASLPRIWGVNLAVSPGVADMAKARLEIEEAADCFHDAFRDSGHGPAWLTLNLSCPNTEDDPHGTQSADLARELCGTLVQRSPMPVWVKIGPDLSGAQLTGLASAFRETGVSAVIATNTWAQAVAGSEVTAGTSGARLRPMALHTVSRLHEILAAIGADIDIVACGGVLSGAHWRAFQSAGARAAMIYSAMVFRGPLAAALILREAQSGVPHA